MLSILHKPNRRVNGAFQYCGPRIWVSRVDLPWTLCCFLSVEVCFNRAVPTENTEQRELAAITVRDRVGCSMCSERDEAFVV